MLVIVHPNKLGYCVIFQVKVRLCLTPLNLESLNRNTIIFKLRCLVLIRHCASIKCSGKKRVLFRRVSCADVSMNSQMTSHIRVVAKTTHVLLHFALYLFSVSFNQNETKVIMRAFAEVESL